MKAEGKTEVSLTSYSPPEEAEVQVLEESDPAGDGGFPEDPFVHSTPAPASLTEEQQRRIDLNKQLALERRLAKQKQLGVWSHLISYHGMTSSSSYNIRVFVMIRMQVISFASSPGKKLGPLIHLY